MVEIDFEYIKVSTLLTKMLAQLSSNKQKDKHKLLEEMYTYLFGIRVEGNSEHYLMPLERPSKSRPSQPKLDHDQIRFLLIGGEPPIEDPAYRAVDLIGLCQLCQINLGMFMIGKHSKRSSEIALMIIQKMLLDPCYDHREEALDEFQDFNSQMEIYPSMSLDKHYMNHIKQRYLLRPENANPELRPNFALDIILVLKKYRTTLPLNQILAKTKHEQVIEKDLIAHQATMNSRLQIDTEQASSDDPYGSEDYGSEYDNEVDPIDKEEDDQGLGPKRSKTMKERKRVRNQRLAQADWAKMPTTWDQVDLESDIKYFNLVEGEAEENRIN